MNALAADEPARRRGVIATPDGALHVGDAVRRLVGGDGAEALWRHGTVDAPELVPGVRALSHGPADGSAVHVWVAYEPESTPAALLRLDL